MVNNTGCITMTIPKKYPLDEDKTKNFVIVDGKVGIVDEKGTYIVPPKYTVINKDNIGNYVCQYNEHNKRIIDVYDSKFEFKHSRTIED